ncbi:hypothetical protein LCGC14_1913130 [marine sediment metagenome]|uniref:Uncharacterized protein n=1 Tax=marine sediment metagenome TaxID=412755 RepID=A0A0F9FST6_9ZZZZ
MGVVEGGSKTHLLVASQAQDNGQVQYGKKKWYAQTFVLPAEAHLWRFRAKQWAVFNIDFCHYALRNTDGSGKPTGTDIVHTTLSPTGMAQGSPGKWRRFDFSEMPLFPPGTYAIIYSVPDHPNQADYRLRTQSVPSGYPAGKCWVSTDSGSTWTQVADTSILFEVWGWEPPPSAPPPPDLDNWAVTEFSKILLDDGFLIQCTTSRPCHLYLRYSLVKPQKHTDPVFRRGLAMHQDPRFCFVSWRENEQETVGDTLTHGWYKRNWAECETRWFYFVGTRAGQQSPSVSPIFELHFGHLLYECDGPELYHDPVNANFTQYAVFKPTTDYAPEHLRATFGRYGEPGEVTLSFFHLGASGWPAGPVLDSCTRTITGIPEIPYFGHFTFQFHKMKLFKHRWYCLRAECTAIPPVSAQWKGWPIDICPNSYVIAHFLYDNTWHQGPEKQFYFLIRGKPL